MAGAAVPARSTDRRELNTKTTDSRIRMGTNHFMSVTPKVDTGLSPTLFLPSRLYCKRPEHTHCSTAVAHASNDGYTVITGDSAVQLPFFPQAHSAVSEFPAVRRIRPKL
jgi:hypothetical protein